ncbi:MAG: hypothetical protein AAB548_00355 [Patescibacteria group bacterium]
MNKKERLLRHARGGSVDIAAELASISGAKSGVVLYAPHFRATDLEVSGTGIAIEPRGEFDGRLSAVELTAVLIVHHEVRTLAELLAFDWQRQEKVREILGFPNYDHTHSTMEVIEGMSDFVYYLAYAAGIRERVIRGEEKPRGTKKTDLTRAMWWDCFGEALVEDELLIGRAVCLQAERAVGELASLRMLSWESRRSGAEIAAELYLALLEESL